LKSDVLEIFDLRGDGNFSRKSLHAACSIETMTFLAIIHNVLEYVNNGKRIPESPKRKNCKASAKKIIYFVPSD
jgi:hypothetical protein